MTYETTTHDPILGRRLWRVTDCKPCDGRGEVWHAGCGDGAATCSACDGAGQIGKYRDIDPTTDKPYGPWQCDD
jgi:DnaJ-class molecular chaperone